MVIIRGLTYDMALLSFPQPTRLIYIYSICLLISLGRLPDCPSFVFLGHPTPTCLAWLSVVGHISKLVALLQAQLVLGWVIVSGVRLEQSSVIRSRTV